MKKHKYHYNTMVVVLLGVALFFFLLAISPSILSMRVNETNKVSYVKNNQEVSSFQSNLHNFKVVYPSSLEVVDKGMNVKFINREGVIAVAVNGTNYNSLRDYLAEFDSRREIEILTSNAKTIGNKQAFERKEFFPNLNSEEKSYYIYSDYSVYIFSTTSPELYDELDQIAESFEYLGE